MTIEILDHTKYEVYGIKSGQTVSDTVLFLSSDESVRFAVYKNNAGSVTGISFNNASGCNAGLGFYGLRKKKVQKTVFVPILKTKGKERLWSMNAHLSKEGAEGAVKHYGKSDRLLGYATLTYEEDAL